MLLCIEPVLKFPIGLLVFVQECQDKVCLIEGLSVVGID
jgi:hypothetical protein